jgi:protein PET100, fungi type
MYVMFPIGFMYYFGTNLDNRFSIPGFWPSVEQSHKLPYEKDDIVAEFERMKQQRIEMRRQQLELMKGSPQNQE